MSKGDAHVSPHLFVHGSWILFLPLMATGLRDNGDGIDLLHHHFLVIRWRGLFLGFHALALCVTYTMK
jgi:hypothetical protein